MNSKLKIYYIKLISILVLYFIFYGILLNISTDYFQIFIFGNLVISFLFFYVVSYIDKQVNEYIDHIV
jgi:hypothetical protein